MTAELPPGLILIVGALAVPLLRAGALRKTYLLLLPLIGLTALLNLESGTFGQMSLLGYELIHVRVDRLSFFFALAFHVSAFVAVVYALDSDDVIEQTAAPVYAGAAIGAVLAGDLLVLFFYAELAAVSSAVVVWAGRSPQASAAGLRYLTVQILGGVFLAAGAAIRAAETGSLAFESIGLDSPGGPFILAALAIKCAFPLVHSWLPDSYPESSPSGTVFLSMFTTKLAVYALARGFAGTDALIWIGAAMAVLPVIYALSVNDLRRLLAYVLISQLGIMVAGIGIGTPLALNGATSHAAASIIYQGLLFMAAGAVLRRAGTARISELGGLARTMPWTAAFCAIGAGAITSVPLLSGFATKSMTLSAAAGDGYAAVYLALLTATAGATLTVGFRLLVGTFFARDSGKRPKEAPAGMLVGMALASALCIGIGVYPDPLYAILPYPADYAPYTVTHVVTMLQLLLLSALAFAVLQRTGLFPPALRSTVLDVDWTYRRLAPRFLSWFFAVGPQIWAEMLDAGKAVLAVALGLVRRGHGPDGLLARTHAVGDSVGVMIAALLVVLLAFFWG